MLAVVGGQIFQLNDIAVLHCGVVLLVRHKEDVAIAVIHFHFGYGEIEGC